MPAEAGPDHEEQQLARMLLGLYGGPAFIRRTRNIEDAERMLADHLQRKRTELLTMVRLRVGQLRALAGDWQALEPLVASPCVLDSLRELHDALAPKLRAPIEPTRSRWVLRSALAELGGAITHFNRRWEKFMAQLDLGPINALRDGYNKHYVIEKECALGNSRVARMGFRRLDPLRWEDLLREYPLLPVPTLAT